MDTIIERIRRNVERRLATHGSATLSELKRAVPWRDRGFWSQGLEAVLKSGDYVCSNGRIIRIGRGEKEMIH